MINKKYLEDLLASKVLASAIFSQLSGVAILEASEDTYGFSCCFRSKQQVHPDLFPYIEQTFKQLVDTNQIKTQEMVRDVAINYLKYKGFQKKAEELRESHPQQVLTILEIGGYVDAVEEELSLDELLPSIKHVKILQAHPLTSSSNQFLIKAVCAQDSSSLKQQLKQIKTAKTNDHLSVFQKQGLISDHLECLVELPKGVAIKREYYIKIVSIFHQHGYQEIFLTRDLEVQALQQLLFATSIVPSGHVYFADLYSTSIDSLEKDLGLYSLELTQAVTFMSKVEDIKNGISIKKTLTLIDTLFKSFGLEYKISFRPYLEHEKKSIDAQALLLESVHCLNLVDKLDDSFLTKAIKGQECQMLFSVEDPLGRLWDLISLEVQGKKENYYLEGKLISLERLLALLQDVNKIFSLN